MCGILPHSKPKEGTAALLEVGEPLRVAGDVAGGVQPEREPVRALHDLRGPYL